MNRPLLIALLITSAGTARAQSNPSFSFAKPEDIKVDPGKPVTPPVEWKAQVKGGLMVTGGNSQTTNGTIAASASRKEGNNKLAVDGAAAYGHSNVLTPSYTPMTPTPMTVIDGLTRTNVLTTNNWLLKGRYDRFLTPNNAAYASGQAAADKIAGKSFFGGGQVGYSRQVYKSIMHTAVAEIGYDFSYERYVESPGKTLDPVAIHSARLFAGDTLKVTPETGINASFEAFFNLNKEGKALDSSTGQPGVDPFHDTRLIGKLGVTTTVWKRLSVGFGFTARYDQNPAPLPVPSIAAAGAAYAMGFQPFAEKLDTLTELNLIYTFL